MYCEDVDDAPEFHNDSTHVPNRTRTTASVKWNNFWAKDEVWDKSPNIASPVGEVIGRPGWSSGNDLAVLCIADTNSNGTPLASSWDASTGKEPVLNIYYTEAAPPAAIKKPQIMGGIVQ